MQVGAFELPNRKFILLLGDFPPGMYVTAEDAANIKTMTGASMVLASENEIGILGDELTLPQDMMDKITSIVEGRDQTDEGQ